MFPMILVVNIWFVFEKDSFVIVCLFASMVDVTSLSSIARVTLLKVIW